jgi:hypothetical protein
MSFRRISNSNDRWLSVVRDSTSLLSGLPSVAVASEAEFRDYMTRGMVDGRPVVPSVFDLSPQALDDLWTFVNHKAQFDMDATLFDNFNKAFQLRHRSNTDNAHNTSLERTRGR